MANITFVKLSAPPSDSKIAIAAAIVSHKTLKTYLEIVARKKKNQTVYIYHVRVEQTFRIAKMSHGHHHGVRDPKRKRTKSFAFGRPCTRTNATRTSDPVTCYEKKRRFRGVRYLGTDWGCPGAELHERNTNPFDLSSVRTVWGERVSSTNDKRFND